MEEDNICCTCFGNHMPSNPNCGGEGKNNCKDGCFNLGTIIADDCDNPVYSCGTEVTVPFDCFCIPCEEPVITITKGTDLAQITEITKEGLTIITNEKAKPGDKIEIEFYMACNEDCNELKSEYGKVLLFVESRCKQLNCDCNECTGECEPEVQLNAINPEVKIIKYNG